MDWYAVTDSDWTWDNVEDGDVPCIVLAENPDAAVGMALEKWKKADGYDFDGVHLKVALMTTVGFQSVEIQNGEAIREPFQALAAQP